jgi:hypothetical protein
MVEFEESVVINRPVPEVFAFVSDLENDPPWTKSTAVRRTSQGPIGVGTTFVQEARFLGLRLHLSCVVVGYEADHSMTVEATAGPLSLDSIRAVEPVGENASKVTASGGGRARGVLRFAERPLAALGAHQLRRQLGRLKQVLEGPTA